VEDRFGKKISDWAGKMLSYGDLLTLINSALTSLPMFMLSFLEIPVGSGKDWTFLGPASFGKAMVIRKNIG
jgi:hypothetical protein